MFDRRAIERMIFWRVFVALVVAALLGAGVALFAVWVL